MRTKFRIDKLFERGPFKEYAYRNSSKEDKSY